MVNKSTEDFLSADEKENAIDLGKIFRFLMMQSKLIISIVFIAFALSLIYYITSQKIIP